MVRGLGQLSASFPPPADAQFTFVLTGMNQQGDSSFMAPGSSPPRNMMQGRMGGPPQNAMMPGMQGNPQGGHMYPSGDMKVWPQGGMPRNKCVSTLFQLLDVVGLFKKPDVYKYKCFWFSSPYPQQQFTQQSNQGQFGSMMMNTSMSGPGPVGGTGAGQMGQIQGQMGMNPMGMSRMPMGPDQVW